MEHPIHILLAEDSPADQRLLIEALRTNGLHHQMQVVSNGEDALSAAQSVGTDGGGPCPDLFILDLHLPKIDGMEVLRMFRSNAHCRHTPVLVLTSSSSPTMRLQIENLPGVHFVQKPLELDEFLNIGKKVKSILLMAQAN
jgi:two-component system, chemotaxis family, response regulator Rcp1